MGWNEASGSYDSSSPPPSPSSSALVSGFVVEIVDKVEGKPPIPKSGAGLLVPNLNGPKKKEIEYF
jgi:hypothetical protein